MKSHPKPTTHPLIGRFAPEKSQRGHRVAYSKDAAIDAENTQSGVETAGV